MEGEWASSQLLWALHLSSRSPWPGDLGIVVEAQLRIKPKIERHKFYKIYKMSSAVL